VWLNICRTFLPDGLVEIEGALIDQAHDDIGRQPFRSRCDGNDRVTIVGAPVLLVNDVAVEVGDQKPGARYRWPQGQIPGDWIDNRREIERAGFCLKRAGVEKVSLRRGGGDALLPY
jgi:hypothetical protein